MFSKSQDQTIEIAKEFAATLKGGEIICLHGNLGAGKTTFMKGIAEYFGINKDEVISPTFIIANHLKVLDSQKFITNLIHIDAYRIEKEDNILETGVLEYFGEENSIVFIEWSTKINSYIQDLNKIDIYFNIVGENERDISIDKR